MEVQRRATRRAKASRLGLSALVQLTAKSRVWNGKGDVIKAAADLAIPWMPFIDSAAASEMLGDSSGVPIEFNGSMSSLDLFKGDKWFETEKVEGDDVEEMETEADTKVLEESLDQEPSDSDAKLSVTGLCRLLLIQSFPSKAALRSITDEEVLPFRSQVLQALETLVKALPSDDMKKAVFSFSATRFAAVFENLETKESPLIVARSLSCFAAMFWSAMSFQGSMEDNDCLNSTKLLSILTNHVDYGKQSAWTVREAAAKCASKCARCADGSTLRSRQFISKLIDIAALGVKDRKFWKVRLASLDILLSLTMREKELILPYKESIQDLAKKSLRDSEAQVTALSTKVLGVLSTWP